MLADFTCDKCGHQATDVYFKQGEVAELQCARCGVPMRKEIPLPHVDNFQPKTIRNMQDSPVEVTSLHQYRKELRSRGLENVD